MKRNYLKLKVAMVLGFALLIWESTRHWIICGVISGVILSNTGNLFASFLVLMLSLFFTPLVVGFIRSHEYDKDLRLMALYMYVEGFKLRDVVMKMNEKEEDKDE